MDQSITKNHHIHESIFSHLNETTTTTTTTTTTQSHGTSTSDFPIAIALLALMAVLLLVVSYYIFVIKSCFNWHNLDPLRRFSLSLRPSGGPHNPDSLFSFSPMADIHRGLDEWLINNIPAFQYNNNNNNNNSSFFRGCAVCLNEFQHQEMLRVLPRCSHVFHLDCIDVWLLNNASCPLCRSSISGRTKYPIDHIIAAPSSSPQEEHFPPFDGDYHRSESDHLVIDLGRFQRKKQSKFQHRSIMGDECIDVREKDEQFEIQQPIRRSFSMDSAIDRGLYLQVQEILRQNRVASSGSGSTSTHQEECQGSHERVRRSSFFSFGHGRGSSTSRSSSILPIEIDR